MRAAVGWTGEPNGTIAAHSAATFASNVQQVTATAYSVLPLWFCCRVLRFALECSTTRPHNPLVVGSSPTRPTNKTVIGSRDGPARDYAPTWTRIRPRLQTATPVGRLGGSSRCSNFPHRRHRRETQPCRSRGACCRANHPYSGYRRSRCRCRARPPWSTSHSPSYRLPLTHSIVPRWCTNEWSPWYRYLCPVDAPIDTRHRPPSSAGYGIS